MADIKKVGQVAKAVGTAAVGVGVAGAGQLLVTAPVVLAAGAAGAAIAGCSLMSDTEEGRKTREAAQIIARDVKKVLGIEDQG